MKKILFSILMSVLTLSSYAYDFYGNGIYYNKISGKTNEVEVTYKSTSYNSYSGSVTIPSTVKCDGKTYSVTSIGSDAFYNCSGLKSVTIPNSVTSIGQDAFYNCSGLKSVTIPNSVTSIGQGAFFGCSALTSITIPNSVTSIGDNAFVGCSGLTSVTIPESVTSIGNWAFSGCNNVKELIYAEGTKTVLRTYLTSITSVTIPNSVTSIKEYAFSGCSGLTSVTIPNSVTSIKEYAFSDCSGLTSVTIPNSVTFIGSSAFSGCDSLTSVTIPNSIIWIGDRAFNGCSSLKDIYNYATIPQSIYSNTFIGLSSNKTLHVVKGCKPAYASTNYWKDFTIVEDLYIKVTEVLLNKVNVEMEEGQSETLTATITPEDATNKTLTWTSSNPNVATIENGMVTALATGTTTITATATDGSGVSASCEIKVIPAIVPVTEIKLNKSNVEIETGKTFTLSATITPEDATTKELTWTSSNPDVATVESGMVTALATGTTTITATATDGSEVNASCEIKVIPAIVPVTEIKLNKSNVEIETGKTFTLSATITPEDATTKELTWTSSNPDVATVESGMVTALAAGTTTITATATDGSEVNASCEVTVKSKSQSEADTDYSTMDNAIYSAKAEGKTGSQFNLPISLKNVATFSGFQFDLYLPEGITVALDEYDEPIMERNERINAKTTLEGAVQTDGCTRFLCYSTKNYAITGNDGDIMSVTLNIADDIKDGDYPIYIKNIVLNTTAAEVIEPQDMKSTISISSYTLGDINNDGKINVGDIGGIASYILGTTPAVFIEKAADYNQDTKINVGDIGGIANFILYGAQTELAKSKAFMPMAETETQAKVFVSPFTIQPGEEKDIEVELTNPDYPVAGAQFDVYLPKGISVVMDEYDEPTISGNRSSKITTEGAIQENGSLRVLAYSSKNYTYSGTEGSIVTITIKADDDIKSGVYDLNIKETVINKYVDKVITTIEPEDYTCSVIVGTPTESSLTLYGNITAETMEELSEALKGNTSLAYIDLRQATNVDAEGVLTSGNKNMLVYLAEGMSIDNTENVIVNNECENLVLTDNADFAPIAPFAATSVTMEKPAEDYGWYTMYLPYAFTPSEDVKVYTFEEAQGNTLVFAQQEGEVPAGTPMLCKRGEGASVMSFSAENVTITTEGVVGGQFIGTFTEIPAGAVTGSYILNVTGTAFGKATEKAYVPAFHCYYVADNSSSVDIQANPIDTNARSNILNIVIKDATGVKTLNMDLNEDVYSWQGFKGEGQINIKNRKKFVK